jgi:serine/threonine-protein kinase
MAQLPPQIGRYEIKSLIGRGGMGDLYLAHDPNTNRLVALKLLNATLDSPELRDRFTREARALAALNHPNIVAIYDTGEFDDSPYIVMEYVRGETLAEMIKRRAALSVSQKLKLMAELCSGLGQAHEAGIIHRDIKPANLMVDQQGRMKILDFGIARVAEGNRTRFGVPLTQVNMVIGTPGYMSPEQIQGGEVDHRSDIFAVGAVCYELLSYDEAFSGTNTRQIERKVLEGQPRPLTSIVPGLDPEVDEIVLRALKRDPIKRYQDAGTFERALERLRARIGPDAEERARRPTPPPPPGPAVKSSEARAEAAYQRSLVAYQAGAPESARRFAVEALAEDPSHAKAQALLKRLESRSPPFGKSQPRPPEPLPPAVTGPTASRAEPTAVATSVGNADPTVMSTAASGAEPTAVATAASRAPSTMVSTGSASTAADRAVSRGRGSPTIASEPTVIIPPRPAESPGRRDRSTTAWGGIEALKQRYEQLWRRDWTRYRRPIEGIALLAVAVGVLFIIVSLTGALRPSGQLLTITRPIGGTISAAGIQCGSRGANCTTKRPNGDPIELTAEADAGFLFVGYTGDCAPGGRTLMTGPRTCGATFAPSVAGSSTGATGPTQVLTIMPVPTGGTIEGVDILCGTKGSVCTANYPDGVPVELHPTADAGFTFMGFVGDCAPLGHTQMKAPRTCSARFSPTEIVSAPPPPPITGPRGGSRRGNPQPSTEPPDSRPQTGGSRPTSASTSPQTGSTSSDRPTPKVDPSTVGQPPPPPPTDEAYAKGKIQEVLKAYCAAYEAMAPDKVQLVYPKVDMNTLKMQLNKSKYKSVTCKFGDPVFVSLDPVTGNAKVQAELKTVFEHTIQEKPQASESIGDITLLRSALRSPWLIDTATFKPKPK